MTVQELINELMKVRVKETRVVVEIHHEFWTDGGTDIGEDRTHEIRAVNDLETGDVVIDLETGR